MTSIKGHNSVKNLRKVMYNNPNLDLGVNINAQTKFGQILSIGSQVIEWKRNSEQIGHQSTVITLLQICKNNV